MVAVAEEVDVEAEAGYPRTLNMNSSGNSSLVV